MLSGAEIWWFALLCWGVGFCCGLLCAWWLGRSDQP